MPVATLVALSVWVNCAGANPLPGQIVVDPVNRAWLFYSDGSPFFLASPGDPEDFLYRGNLNGDGTRNGDQNSIIDKLASTSANGIYMQIIRSNGGDGDATHNPFINNDPTQGLNNAVLDQWDSWFQRMDDAGIVIYLFFYDDSASIWNTGNLVGNDERQFFSAIVNRFKGYKHLIWVVGEEYAERFSAARVSALAAIIRANDEHEHPIGVHKNNGVSFSEFANDPNIDQFSMQYNETDATTLHNGVVTAWNQASSRYNINMSEATQWGTGANARIKAWASTLGGSYVMGLGMDIASTPISDLNDLGRLRNFMEATDFHTMEPRDDLANGGAEWVLANPAVSYIAYGRNVPASMGIRDVQAGTYTLLWLDTVSGNSITETDVTTNSGDANWPKPVGIGSEVALYVLKTGAVAQTRPLPPSNLTAE